MDTVATELESSLLAQTLLRFLEQHPQWRSTPYELFEELKANVSDDVVGSREWPSNPQKLSGQLKRLEVALQTVGIT